MPLTCIANRSSLCRCVRLRASPRLPNGAEPSRFTIFWVMAKSASPLPNRRSMPSVSAGVRIPFSKHSMAKAMATPAEMLSRTCWPQIWWNWAMTLRSPMPQKEPLAAIVSYSGPPLLVGHAHLGTSTSRLQATAHA